MSGRNSHFSVGECGQFIFTKGTVGKIFGHQKNEANGTVKNGYFVPFSPSAIFLPLLMLFLHFPHCFVDDPPPPFVPRLPTFSPISPPFPPISPHFPPFPPISPHFPPFPPIFPISPIFPDSKIRKKYGSGPACPSWDGGGRGGGMQNYLLHFSMFSCVQSLCQTGSPSGLCLSALFTLILHLSVTDTFCQYRNFSVLSG